MDYQSFVFPVSTLDNTQAKVSELNNILNKVGISAFLQEFRGNSLLVISYDMSKLNQKLTRGAGRKVKSTIDYSTIAEVKEMRNTLTEKEVLQKLGISRSTYYRRWKEIEQMESLDDMLF